jgi:hypothetical protein
MLCSEFHSCLAKSTICGTNVFDTKCVFQNLLKLLSVMFLIPEIIQPHISNNVLRSSRKMPGMLSNYNHVWIFSIYFSKTPSIKFNANLFSGSRIVPCGWTYGHDDNSCFSQCCESTQENYHVSLFYGLNCYQLLNFIATVLIGNNYHDIVLEFSNITM